MDIVFFLMPVPASVVIAGLVALAPAMLNAWRDRTLLARPDDPVLPERLLATRWWIAVSVGFSLALLVTLWPWQALWTVPLLLLSRRWFAFRMRRALLGERWPFHVYLNFFARTLLALPAFALTLIAAPAIVWFASTTPTRWAVAATLGLLLGIWQTRHTHLLLRLWQAAPIAREEMPDAAAAAFEAIAGKAAIGRPLRVWQAGPPGAVVANAVALPSVEAADVLFSRTLIERLTADELAAIFAHEVAHLEYFSPARMLRQRQLAFAQIAAGVTLVPLLSTVWPEAVLPAIALWPLVVLLATIGRTAKVHGNELASDRRALELCGNPDALVSGLTKTHTIARLPRRWDAHATKHPSLARRTRAIRELAGFRAPNIESIEIFPSPAGDSFLLLDRTMLQHAAGVPVAAAAAGDAYDVSTILARAHTVRRIPYTAQILPHRCALAAAARAARQRTNRPRN